MKVSEAPVGSWTRMAAAVLVAVSCVAAPAAAQLARVRAAPSAPKLLVVPFGRTLASDSDLAMEIPDGIRERMRLDHTGNFQTILKKAMCDILIESGFPCTSGLERNVIGQLARFANARYVIDGMIYNRGRDSLLILARLVEAFGQSPLAASTFIEVARNQVNSRIGRDLADRLADKYRAFEYVSNCRNAREQKDYQKAVEQAQRALRYDSQSGGAYLCMALARQDMGAPTDSVQGDLERAHDADSLNTVVARQLARIYEEKHDTTQLLHMLHHILQMDAGDNELRIATARLYVLTGHADSAVMLLDTALARNPNQYDILNAKSVSLAAARDWAAAAAALAQGAEVDSSKVDSLFIQRIIVLYDSAGDSTSAFDWVRRATQRLPEEPAYWYRYATELLARRDTAQAMTAIRRFITLAPNDGRGHLVLATLLLGAGHADSTDTATIRAFEDSAVMHAKMAGDADSAYRVNAAPIFLRVGAAALQRQKYPRADTLLTVAKEWAGPQTAPTAGFYLGVAQVQLGLAAVQQAQGMQEAARRNQAVRDSACALVRSGADYLNLAEPNLTANAAVNRDLANSLLTYLPQLRAAFPQLNRALRCPS
jgi:tetratricopeptide (TPR) repeat protein